MRNEFRKSAISYQRSAPPPGRQVSATCLLRGRPEISNRSAFTMMELMIAVAVLGIGMTMAAALFPAAIRENQISINDTIGNLI